LMPQELVEDDFHHAIYRTRPRRWRGRSRGVFLGR
jgi:hypothetical protein